MQSCHSMRGFPGWLWKSNEIGLFLISYDSKFYLAILIQDILCCLNRRIHTKPLVRILTIVSSFHVVCFSPSVCLCTWSHVWIATWSSARDSGTTFGEYAAGWCSFPLLPQEASEFANLNKSIPFFSTFAACCPNLYLNLHIFPKTSILPSQTNELCLWVAVVCSYLALEIIWITFISLADTL